jgi:hypothetical protein
MGFDEQEPLLKAVHDIVPKGVKHHRQKPRCLLFGRNVAFISSPNLKLTDSVIKACLPLLETYQV